MGRVWSSMQMSCCGASGRSVCRAASLSDLQPVRSEAQTETLLCPTELGQLGLNTTHTTQGPSEKSGQSAAFDQ